MINALEELVRAVHSELREKYAEGCACQQCQDDVITMAMNHLRPRYIVGEPMGAALTRVSLSQAQARAEIAVVVFDAMRRVGANPRHTPRYTIAQGARSP